MNSFNALIRDVEKAGEGVGKNIDKLETKCPKCKGIMCLLKKYLWLDKYFWICDCGVNFPASIE